MDSVSLKTKNKYLLEVCSFSLQSSLVAEKVGAHRVELCANPIEGGTTPSYGAIKVVRDKVSIQLYPLLRPRAGNYWYSDEELEILKKDILLCRELKCDGISVGVQLQNGLLDLDSMKQIVDLAYPLGVTCNRAFDTMPNPYAALELLIDCGCERVLTSGLASTAPDGSSVLKKLVAQANNRITIMPGAGIKSSNIAMLIKETQATEYHTSARKLVPNTVSFSNPAILDFGNVYLADEQELAAVISIMEQTSIV